jgi:hypothetical protein
VPSIVINQRLSVLETGVQVLDRRGRIIAVLSAARVNGPRLAGIGAGLSSARGGQRPAPQGPMRGPEGTHLEAVPEVAKAPLAEPAVGEWIVQPAIVGRQAAVLPLGVLEFPAEVEGALGAEAVGVELGRQGLSKAMTLNDLRRSETCFHVNEYG